jgi:hypothetical protein
MYIKIMLLLFLSVSSLYAQLTYEDLAKELDAGTSQEEIKEKIYDQGIVFDINRKLLNKMSKEGRPDWIIDFLMEYDQPVYTASNEYHSHGHSHGHSHSHYHGHVFHHRDWRWHRPFVGYGFWPSLYMHRYGPHHGIYDYYNLRFPYYGFSYWGALSFYDPFYYWSPYGGGYYGGIRYGGSGYTRGRLTPNGIIITDGNASEGRQAIRRGSSTRVQNRSTQSGSTVRRAPASSSRTRVSSSSNSPRTRAISSSNNSRTRATSSSNSSRTRATSSSSSSRTRASAPSRSRSSSSSDNKAVKRRN